MQSTIGALKYVGSIFVLFNSASSPLFPTHAHAWCTMKFECDCFRRDGHPILRHPNASGALQLTPTSAEGPWIDGNDLYRLYIEHVKRSAARTSSSAPSSSQASQPIAGSDVDGRAGAQAASSSADGEQREQAQAGGDSTEGANSADSSAGSEGGSQGGDGAGGEVFICDLDRFRSELWGYLNVLKVCCCVYTFRIGKCGAWGCSV